MSLYIDSEANFKSRALAVGIDEAVVNRAVASGIRSLASYAFASTYQPGSNDDTPLRQLVAPWLELPAGTEPTAAMMSPFRRLYFEANALALSEIKARTEATDEVVRHIPLAERSARHAAQQARLGGLDLSGEFECSHGLLDLAQQMWDTNVAAYLPIEKCTRRSDELGGQKKVLS